MGALPFYPFPGSWNRGSYIHFCLLDGVDELYMPGQQAYAAVGVGAFGPVLEVPFDGAAHVGKLAADLVVPAGVQLHFQQEITVCGLDEGVFEAGFLSVLGHIGFVLGFVAHQVVRERVAVFGRAVGGKGPVCLVDFSFPEHLVQALQGLGGFGKEHHAAHGPVQPVRDSHEYLPGLDRILSVREAFDLLSIPVDELLKFYAGKREMTLSFLLRRICRSNPIYHFPIIGEPTYTLKGVMEATGKGRSWSLFFLERNCVRAWCVGVHYLYAKVDVDNAWRKESIMWDEWIPLLQVPGVYGLDIRVVLQQIANGVIQVRPGQREQLVSRKDIKMLWKRMAE